MSLSAFKKRKHKEYVFSALIPCMSTNKNEDSDKKGDHIIVLQNRPVVLVDGFAPRVA
jgi:hypothetical protein